MSLPHKWRNKKNKRGIFRRAYVRDERDCRRFWATSRPKDRGCETAASVGETRWCGLSCVCVWVPSSKWSRWDNFLKGLRWRKERGETDTHTMLSDLRWCRSDRQEAEENNEVSQVQRQQEMEEEGVTRCSGRLEVRSFVRPRTEHLKKKTKKKTWVQTRGKNRSCW